MSVANVELDGRKPKRPHVGITFHHPVAFWVGSAAIAIGVLLHIPDYAGTADMGFMMDGMPMSGVMLFGMGLIVAGIGLAVYGLFPRRSALGIRGVGATGYHVKAMDDAPLTGAHWGLLFVLGIALIVDVMKPATLGFVVPGMREEYGLTTGQAALLPLFALTGTTIGSVLWGILADRLGRRAAIMLSSLMFIGTAICGFMPGFGWNLLMCFLMGTAAGGMLPIVYALMAESVPAKKRGWLVVLHGGMGTVGGYLVASGLATLLEPHFAWRILWFLNLPTGALMLVLNRWIPESPRFLLERGQLHEARQVMSRYGVTLERDEPGHEPDPGSPDEHSDSHYAGVRRLFRRPYLGRTSTVFLYGLSWGLVNWGFLTFLPTFLQDAGFATGSASGLLFVSSLIAVPGTVLVAYLYGMWSSKKSMILYAAATAATLVGFAVMNPQSADATNRALLIGLVVALLVASGGVISMLSPYTAEVYPTYLRGTGSGLAAGSSKLGGIVGPSLLAGGLVVGTSLAVPALVVAAPMALSAVVLAVRGVETRGRRLEDISRDLGHPVAPSKVDG